jgi:hypothetical protein
VGQARCLYSSGAPKGQTILIRYGFRIRNIFAGSSVVETDDEHHHLAGFDQTSRAWQGYDEGEKQHGDGDGGMQAGLDHFRLQGLRARIGAR